MKRPRILVDLMVQRRLRALKLREFRAYFRECGIKPTKRRRLLPNYYPIPRVTVKSLLRLAAQNRVFAGSRWKSHDTEYYSACGWDDYQIERRNAARNAAREYSKAARFLHGSKSCSARYS